MRINTMLNSSALRVRNRLRRKTPGTNTFCATRANAFSAGFACVCARRSWESVQSVLPAEASQLLYRRNSINRSGIHSVSHVDSAYLSARRAHLLKKFRSKKMFRFAKLHRDALHRLRRKMRDKCFFERQFDNAVRAGKRKYHLHIRQVRLEQARQCGQTEGLQIRRRDHFS